MRLNFSPSLPPFSPFCAAEDETEETSDAAGVMRLSAEMTSSMTKSLEGSHKQ